jgi:hypothetical protein
VVVCFGCVVHYIILSYRYVSQGVSERARKSKPNPEGIYTNGKNAGLFLVWRARNEEKRD